MKISVIGSGYVGLRFHYFLMSAISLNNSESKPRALNIFRLALINNAHKKRWCLNRRLFVLSPSSKRGMV